MIPLLLPPMMKAFPLEESYLLPDDLFPTLFKPRLSTMSYDKNTVLNSVMETISINICTIQAHSFYKVPYRKIMNVTTALESIQEQRVTPLVENDNQQQIYRWFRNYILLPSDRGHYTDWKLCKSVEGKTSWSQDAPRCMMNLVCQRQLYKGTWM